MFTIRNGVARKTVIKIGHRGEIRWEVLNGLHLDDKVIVHPSTDVKDGARVRILN